jgi:hypothetical protein
VEITLVSVKQPLVNSNYGNTGCGVSTWEACNYIYFYIKMNFFKGFLDTFLNGKIVSQQNFVPFLQNEKE